MIIHSLVKILQLNDCTIKYLTLLYRSTAQLMQFYSKAIGELRVEGRTGWRREPVRKKALQLRTRYLFISQART